MSKRLTTLFLALVGAVTWTAASAQQNALHGVWEGVWYRGMTSGKLRLELTEGGGSIQVVGLDSFGEGAQPLRDASVAGGTVSLQAAGRAGTPLKATLTANSATDAMKGFGSYQGFTLRLEVRRRAP